MCTKECSPMSNNFLPPSKSCKTVRIKRLQLLLINFSSAENSSQACESKESGIETDIEVENKVSSGILSCKLPQVTFDFIKISQVLSNRISRKFSDEFSQDASKTFNSDLSNKTSLWFFDIFVKSFVELCGALWSFYRLICSPHFII